MTDPFGRAAGESLVVAITAPLPPDPTLQDALAEHVADIELHFVPYNESREARAARGANNGKLPAGVEVPELDDATRQALQRAHVIVGLDLPPDAAVTPSLKWFQAISAGTDQLDLAQLNDMGVQLTSARGVASNSIAEFVMARLLGIWKNLRTIETNQREQTWTEHFGTEVGGRTMLVVGLGSIGRAVARRAKAFDMHLIATRGSAQPGDTDPDVDELHPASALDDLLPNADAVVCSLPGSATTVDLFDAAKFQAMKADAIFCNVGRGSLVVEQDLIATLESGHLRGAVLDVMRNEPLPAADPLWTAPRAYLSPHVAVSLDRYQENAWAILSENLRRMISGEPLMNQVNLGS